MMPRSHVIVIDDDPAAAASVCALLASFGYDVTSFDSAEAFLDSEAANSCACLLLDLQLPGMSGRELQKKLIQRELRLPIILVSGYADSALITAAMDDGAVAVLEKPVNPKILLNHVQRTCEDTSKCHLDSKHGSCLRED